MIHIEEAVIVEGKYDKIKLSNFLDAMIVETGGFAIYKDKKRLQFIRRLAMERGIIILHRLGSQRVSNSQLYC